MSLMNTSTRVTTMDEKVRSEGTGPLTTILSTVEVASCDCIVTAPSLLDTVVELEHPPEIRNAMATENGKAKKGKYLCNIILQGMPKACQCKPIESRVARFP